MAYAPHRDTQAPPTEDELREAVQRITEELVELRARLGHPDAYPGVDADTEAALWTLGDRAQELWLWATLARTAGQSPAWRR